MSSHLELDSQSYSAQVDVLRERISDVTAKYDAVSIERDTMQFKVKQGANRILGLEGVEMELRESVGKYSGMYKVGVEELEGFRVEFETYKRVVKRLEMALDESAANCSVLEDKLEGVKVEKTESVRRVETLEGDYGVLNASLEDMKACLTKSREEKAGLVTSVTELENTKSNLTLSLSDKATLVAALEETVMRLREEVKESGDRVMEFEAGNLLRVMERGKVRDEVGRLEAVLEEVRGELELEKEVGEKNMADTLEVSERG
jgi:chromosome segregation ATPase